MFIGSPKLSARSLCPARRPDGLLRWSLLLRGCVSARPPQRTWRAATGCDCALRSNNKSVRELSLDSIAFKTTKHILRAAYFLRDLCDRLYFSVLYGSRAHRIRPISSLKFTTSLPFVPMSRSSIVYVRLNDHLLAPDDSAYVVPMNDLAVVRSRGGLARHLLASAVRCRSVRTLYSHPPCSVSFCFQL